MVDIPHPFCNDKLCVETFRKRFGTEKLLVETFRKRFGTEKLLVEPFRNGFGTEKLLVEPVRERRHDGAGNGVVSKRGAIHKVC
jgi:hypothetical protein